MHIETHWREREEASSMGLVVEESLVNMERHADDEGWEQPPVRIGAVYLNLVGDIGMLSVNMLAELPRPVLENPQKDLPVMVDLLVRDIANEDKDADWIYDLTGEAEGFIGFVFLLQGLNDSGAPARNLLFYSRTQGVFMVYRAKDEQPDAGWVPEAGINRDDMIVLSLIKMTDVAHFARVRHQLFSV